MITYVFYQKLSKPCFYNVLIWPLFIGSLWLALKKCCFCKISTCSSKMRQKWPMLVNSPHFSGHFDTYENLEPWWAHHEKLEKPSNFSAHLVILTPNFDRPEKAQVQIQLMAIWFFFLIFFLFFIMFRANLANISLK